jgi:hypothetical protein
VRWQLEHQSMRLDSTIALLSMREMRRVPDVVAYAERGRVRLWDLLAYSALAETGGGRLRLVAVLPGHPDTAHPDVLCLDGPRTSKHRNPPFEDGIFGKSATLCLYYRQDPTERRWAAEHGLLGLFDIARVHVTNEYIWRRTGKWPSEDAPHGVTAPAPEDPSLALPPLSPRNTVLHRRPSTLPASDQPSAASRAAA